MKATINEQALGMRKQALPAFGPGDQVRVWGKIIERDRTRLVPFEGIVVRSGGTGLSETFIVRRVTHGEGVERVFPIHAPVLERVEVLQQARPRRARLYFLRTKVGKTKIAAATQPSTPAPAKPTAEDAPAAAVPPAAKTKPRPVAEPAAQEPQRAA